MAYDIGDAVRVKATFSVSGVNTDPTMVKCKVMKPKGTIATYVYGTDAGVVKDATGIYHFDVTTIDQSGFWSYRWEGTGNCQAADEAEFQVSKSKIVKG